MLCIPCNSIQR